MKKCFLFKYESTVRAESVGPLKRIYQRVSPLPIFNVDPHHIGTDATVERNIDTSGGKGEFCSETRSLRLQFHLTMDKNLILVL